MTWLDTCAQQYLSGDILIKIAKIIDREDDTQWLKEEQQFLKTLINEQMWDEKTAFYYDMIVFLVIVGRFYSLLFLHLRHRQSRRHFYLTTKTIEFKIYALCNLLLHSATLFDEIYLNFLT